MEHKMMMRFAGEEELSLGLSLGGGSSSSNGEVSSSSTSGSIVGRKRGFSEIGNTGTIADHKKIGDNKDVKEIMNHAAHEAPPPKAQIVGWPPVRSYRKNNLMASSTGVMIKVSIDGAPYLRKVDLKMYKSYQSLSDALGKMFSSFTIGNNDQYGSMMIDFMNESKLMDGSDFVPTYEDKDGDWMLVGDVPWEMFVESCKRIRIVKGNEAVGLAPRAMEKYGKKRKS